MISVVIISKDEPCLDETLADVTRQLGSLDEPGEIVVVDASSGRLDHIRQRHAPTRTMGRFPAASRGPGLDPAPAECRRGRAAGDIIVFTDAGCRPRPGWLERLVAPLRADENVTAGVSQDLDGKVHTSSRTSTRWRNYVPAGEPHAQLRLPPCGFRRGGRLRRELPVRFGCGFLVAA